MSLMAVSAPVSRRLDLHEIRSRVGQRLVMTRQLRPGVFTRLECTIVGGAETLNGAIAVMRSPHVRSPLASPLYLVTHVTTAVSDIRISLAASPYQPHHDDGLKGASHDK